MRQLHLPNRSSASALLREIFFREPAQQQLDMAHPDVLYGAGEFGRVALDFFMYVGVMMKFKIDRAAHHIDLLWGIIPEYRPEQSQGLDNYLIPVMIVNGEYSEISEQLKKRELNKILLFYIYVEMLIIGDAKTQKVKGILSEKKFSDYQKMFHEKRKKISI